MSDHSGVKGYSLQQLMILEKDLRKNPVALKKGSWENERMKAVSKEIAERIKKMR